MPQISKSTWRNHSLKCESVLDKHRGYCGDIKTDQHLFLNVTFPHKYGMQLTPLLTNNIRAEEDGVQMTLPLLFQHNLTDEILCKNFFLLWYIWKARNDKRFQRRTWTSHQIQQAANAHINSHLDALK